MVADMTLDGLGGAGLQYCTGPSHAVNEDIRASICEKPRERNSHIEARNAFVSNFSVARPYASHRSLHITIRRENTMSVHLHRRQSVGPIQHLALAASHRRPPGIARPPLQPACRCAICRRRPCCMRIAPTRPSRAPWPRWPAPMPSSSPRRSTRPRSAGMLKTFLDLLPQDGLARQAGAAAGHRRQPVAPAGAGLCAAPGAGMRWRRASSCPAFMPPRPAELERRVRACTLDAADRQSAWRTASSSCRPQLFALPLRAARTSAPHRHLQPSPDHGGPP